MYKEEGETTYCMFNNCKEASKIWDNGETLFRKYDRVKGNTFQILIQWRSNPFKKCILNNVWKSFLGFLI
jgi:hypothetical protein